MGDSRVIDEPVLRLTSVDLGATADITNLSEVFDFAKDYLGLLKDDLIRPTKLDLWVMDENGGNKRQVTRNGKANFAPFFFPNGKRIIFASNLDDPRGRDFEIYTINVDGSGLERITFNDTFDGFPMFSPDGKKIVFASNRKAAKQGDTNVFIADWVE